MQVAMIDCSPRGGHGKGSLFRIWPDCKYPVVGLITEWGDDEGNVETRTEKSDLGGTMRLGSQLCHLVDDCQVRQMYDAADDF
ncbi:hypothetical protein ACNKHX_16880 [Shigella flexneri]